MGSHLSLFLFYIPPRWTFLGFNLQAVSAHFWPQYFLIPRRWTLVFPYGVTIWSLSALLWRWWWYRKSFLDFILGAVSALFWPLFFLIVTDGWWVMMGDDGWWWVMMGDGWSKKKFSDFAQNFFRWSLGDINVRKFGKSAKNFFYRKKIQLHLSKSDGFLIKLRMGNL